MDAIDRNLMSISKDKLYDTPRRKNSPYINQIAFAATSIKSKFETKGGLKFVFEQDCFFTNTGLKVTTMQIDADDGRGFHTVSFGNVFTASYSSSGTKDFKVKIKFSNDDVHSCHFAIDVKKLSSLKSARYHNTETLAISSSSIRAYKGKKASGKVTIIYNGTTKVLDKPFIVFEGYDTWKILTPNNPSTNITWENFLDNPSGRFQSYFNATFQRELEARGYDIIFVDYKNATDYIQRNAYFAEAIINAVNLKKVGDEPNVVIGISMGGLVGRYALSDMENRGEEHETHMFISMDSPHQGANVPLGIQALVRHLTEVKLEVGLPGLTAKVWDLGDVAKDYPAFINLLQQPATRQMLIEQLSGFGEGMYRDNSIHNAFMQEYKQLGYPQKCRNIAISNGSGASKNSWQYNPSTNIFDLSGDCKGDWWTDFLGGAIIACNTLYKTTLANANDGYSFAFTR